MKLPTTLTALTVALAAAAPSADAQDQYFAVYQEAAGAQVLARRMIDAALDFTFNSHKIAGQHIGDIETYWHESGVLYHDAIYRDAPPGSSTKLLRDVLEADLAATVDAEYANGLQVRALASRLDPDGERRFTMVFEDADAGPAAPELLTITETADAWMTGLQGPDWRPVVTEQYYVDDDLHTVAVWRSSTNVNFTFNKTLADFVQRVADEQAAGNVVQSMGMFRKRFDGEPRFTATFEPGNGAESAQILVMGIDEPTLVDTTSDEEANDRWLSHFTLLFGADTGWSNYGTGLAGTGAVPELTLTENPYVGQTIGINMGNETGDTALSALYLGLTPADIPFKGGELLVIPFSSILLPIASSGLELTTDLPPDPALDDFTLYLQLVQQDAGAPKGLALSQGLEMNFGHLD